MEFDRIALTGACGRIGRYVAGDLAAHASVIRTDRQEAAEDDPGIVHANLLELSSLCAAFEGQNAVVHTAGADASADVPSEVTFKTNVIGTWNVLEAARLVGINKVVVCTSASVVGVWGEKPPHYLPIDEAHPNLSANTYCLSKSVSETVAKDYSNRYGMHVICIRPAYIVYPEIIDEILKRVGTAGEGGIGEPGSGATYKESLSPTRSYVRPDDLVDCFRLAVQLNGSGFNIFNATADDTYSPDPILSYCLRVFGKVPAIRDQKRWEQDPYASMFSNTNAKRTLGWQPSVRWADVVKERESSR